MKKSEVYNCAMIAVINSVFPAEMKLEVIEVLMNDKSVAEWSEKKEEDAE